MNTESNSKSDKEALDKCEKLEAQLSYWTEREHIASVSLEYAHNQRLKILKELGSTSLENVIEFKPKKA